MVLAVHHIAQLKKCNLRNTAVLFFAVYHSKSRRSSTESLKWTQNHHFYTSHCAHVRECHAAFTLMEVMYNLTRKGIAINSGRLLIRYSDKRSHVQVHSAWESALFFSPGGVVAWALERIEINRQAARPMGHQRGSLRRTRGQSRRAVGVSPVQTLRGAIG